MKFDDNIKKEYRRLWNTCLLNPQAVKSVEALSAKMITNKSRYDVIADKTSVPWFIIATIHNMECSLDFSKCLHNGQPWNKVTTKVPKNRGPWASFEEAAIDAFNYDGLASWKDWSLEGSFYKLEAYNGWGYRGKGVNSPYLWSKTNNYTIGKYVERLVDGIYKSFFEPGLISDQMGCAAVFKGLKCFDNVITKPTGIQKYIKGANIQLAANFNLSELDCKCTRPECKETLVDLDHIASLQLKREQIGRAIHINCGFRCLEHNLEVGGVKGSQHQLGTATDITINGMTPQQIAQTFDDFDGVGVYATFVHVDSRGHRARWVG